MRRIFFHWCAFFAVLFGSVIAMQTFQGDPSKDFASRFWQEIKSFTLIGIVMLSLLPAFMLDTIRFSNRFVGPVSRLRRALRELKDGKQTRIQFRGTDFWSEMGEEFNQLAELIESQQKEIERLKRQQETVTV